MMKSAASLPKKETYESKFPKSKTKILKDLPDELIGSASENGLQLTLHAHNITSATFKWCMQTMGVDHLTLTLLPDPAESIVYSEDDSSLTITGQCIAFDNWESTLYTIKLSSGNIENTIMYAITTITADYADFSLPLLAATPLTMAPSHHDAPTFGFGQSPPQSQSQPTPVMSQSESQTQKQTQIPGFKPAHALPPHSLPLVFMRVQSTSAFNYPNCKLLFGSGSGESDDEEGGMTAISPEWVICPSICLSTSYLGLSLANAMTKGGVIERSLKFNATVNLGNVSTPITIVAPVNYLSQKHAWYAQVSTNRVTLGSKLCMVSGLDLTDSALVRCLGLHVALAHTLPPPLIAQGGFSLAHYYLQFDPVADTVWQISMNIAAPSWVVVPPSGGLLVIDNTSINVQTYNPFSAHNSSASLNIFGKCGSESVAFKPNACVFATPCANSSASCRSNSSDSGEWCVQVSDEDDQIISTSNIKFTVESISSEDNESSS